MTAQETVVKAASLDERVAAHGEKLTPKERGVATFFGTHREEAAFLSAAEIARQLGTSDATVVRAVKALGYAGIPQLKRELIDALRARATPASRLGNSLEDAGEDPLGHAIGLELELLESARSLDRNEFGRAVDLLAAAGRVLAYGLGPKGPLADYFALRLARFGRPAQSIGSSGLLLADQLLAARPGDALLLLSFERLDGDSDVALARANALGLPVVLLTDTLGPKLADRVDVALPVLRGRSGAFSGSATTMAILDALLLAVAARDRARSLAALAELNGLRRQLRGAPVQNELR